MTAWQPIETAPRDGTHFWAYLYHTGIRKLFWASSEVLADYNDADPDDYEPMWTEVGDLDEWWEPNWWLPLDAIPDPPQ